MTKVTHEFDLYGKHYTLEAGELAKQATGACIVKCGDSTVLLTAVVSKERKDYDFFPLTVDFMRKCTQLVVFLVDTSSVRLVHPRRQPLLLV